MLRPAAPQGFAANEDGLLLPRGLGGTPLLQPGESLKGLLRGIEKKLRGIGFTMAGFSNFMELEVLDSVFGDHASINLFSAPTYLALCTVAVGETDTGSTITEANYTGYARKSMAASDLSAASAGSKTNSNAITFAACTAGSSTVIGWAQCAASSAGNIGVYGTCTSTVISTTQTPATVAIGGLVANLD